MSMPGSRGGPWVTLLAGLLAVVVTQVLPGSYLCAAGDKSAAKSRSPWIMVSLSPDGCTGGCRRLAGTIRDLSGNPNGMICHFSSVTPERIAEIRPEFIVLSPQGTPWCRYTGEKGIALQNFFWLLPVIAEEMNVPILGICGGHQALALAFGGRVGPIRAGDADCMPYSRDRQGGVVHLTMTAPDPIFNGLGREVHILQSHYDEVKILPPGFVLLASEKVSPIQIMRHPTRPVYGIQGHPECFYGNRPDGGLLIRNFLKIASTFNETVRNPQTAALPALISLRLPQQVRTGR